MTTGPARWRSEAWLEAATRWLDAALADAGLARTGPVEQPHLRLWGTVLRAPTTAGPVWLKEPAATTAFEIPLYAVLARRVPDAVLVPIAADDSLVLLPDGGATLHERSVGGEERAAGLGAALAAYGDVQRRLVPHVGELLAAGVADMRPERLPERLDEALEVTAPIAERYGTAEQRRRHVELVARRSTVLGWCRRLGKSPLAPSLDHNDLHPGNVLPARDGSWRFYDWGDSVVAHPLTAALVALRVVRHELGTDQDDPRLVGLRARHLAGFAPLAPGEDLAATLELACRVARIARTLTWERAVRDARAADDPAADSWATAPLETLLPILDASYLGDR